MEYFSTKYGLVTDNDPTTENGQLFLADYILLLHKNVDIISFLMTNDLMKDQLRNSETSVEGLYNRNIDLVDRRCMSHDNLSGIMAWSVLAGTDHRFKIWKYLVKHLGTYDNTQGKSTQFSRILPFNPSNFFAWGLAAESKLAYLFFPLFLINLIISCNKKPEDTSGKILSWIEMYPLSTTNIIVKLCFKYYEKKMKAQYGNNYIVELRKLYHGTNSTNFPINKVLGINA
jgi:hypothetical protein